MKSFKRTYPIGKCKMTQYGWIPVDEENKPSKQDNTVLYLYIVIIIIACLIACYAFSTL